MIISSEMQTNCTKTRVILKIRTTFFLLLLLDLCCRLQRFFRETMHLYKQKHISATYPGYPRDKQHERTIKCKIMFPPNEDQDTGIEGNRVILHKP